MKVLLEELLDEVHEWDCEVLPDLNYLR